MSDSKAVRGSRGGSAQKRTSIPTFLRQVIAELRKVVTPTRKELFKFTGVVLVFVLIVMGIVYGLDTLFAFVTHWVFGIPG